MSTSINTKIDFDKSQPNLQNCKPLLCIAYAIPTLTWILWAATSWLMNTDQQGAGIAVGMAMMTSGFLGGFLAILLSLVTIAICLFHFRQTTWSYNLRYLVLSVSAIVFSIGTFVGITNLVFADWTMV